jgi:hypothetical protein
LKDLPVVHAYVWGRGTLTAFYVREPLSGAFPGMRMAYLFTRDGLWGGGTCPAEQGWKDCIENLAGVEGANNVPRTCAATVDMRTLPAWKPSPNDLMKRRVADALRNEIEAKWQGVREIVLRDFNLNDNQITMYLKMPDGDYFQGCGFRAVREPHCEGWHLFGQAPVSYLRKRVFEKPYRLK